MISEPKNSTKKPTSSIFVGGLKASFTEEVIKAYFTKFGEVESIEMKKRKKGINKGFCIVKFSNGKIAERVLKRKEHFIEKRLVTCREYLNGGELKKSKQEKNNRKIYISGLSPDITNEDIMDFFKKFGEVEAGYSLKNDITGKSKGFGFVTFQEEISVEKVFENAHDLELKGAKISVERFNYGKKGVINLSNNNKKSKIGNKSRGDMENEEESLRSLPEGLQERGGQQEQENFQEENILGEGTSHINTGCQMQNKERYYQNFPQDYSQNMDHQSLRAQPLLWIPMRDLNNNSFPQNTHQNGISGNYHLQRDLDFRKKEYEVHLQNVQEFTSKDEIHYYKPTQRQYHHSLSSNIRKSWHNIDIQNLRLKVTAETFSRIFLL